MEIITKSPQTPPPRVSYDNGALLTPPPTGGFKKRVQFLGDETEESLPKRLATSKEYEPLSPAGSNETCKFDVSSTGGSSSDSQEAQSSNGEAPDSPLTERSLAFDNGKLGDQQDAHPDTSINQSCLPDGINFLDLPLKVRKNIFRLLLSVPAIVCVRQNRTAFDHLPLPWANATEIQLLPGISFAATQTECNGMKSRFSRHPYTNVGILRTNSKMYHEAKPMLYGFNTFELPSLSRETCPPVDFSTPLFPRGCPRLIRNICIQGCSIYSFRFMVLTGQVGLKNHYRSLETLHLILELESVQKGYGKKLVRQPKENWTTYVKRLMAFMAVELFDCVGIAKKIPAFIDLKAMFIGDSYSDAIDLNKNNTRGKSKSAGDTDVIVTEDEEIKKEYLKRGVSEAFELFKKGRR